jgi:hypoxanthine phosphoribosyltransferase
LSGIVINGERFSPLITAAQIREETKRLAEKINKELAGLDVIFIVVLNGAFVFAADLLRYLDFQPEITFIRVGLV